MEQDSQKVKVVIIMEKSKLADLVFPITAIYKNLYRQSASFHFIFFGPGKDYPLQDLEQSMKQVSAPYHLYLLDVGPTEDISVRHWIYFANQQKNHIKLWLGNEFSKQDLEKISAHQVNINPIKGGIFKTLKSQGYHFWPYLKKAHESLLRENNRQPGDSIEASRYYLAKSALMQMGAEPDGYEICLLVMEMVKELSTGKISNRIEKLITWKIQAINYTREAIARFRDDYFFFREAKRKHRPIGYIDLGIVPDYADIQEIIYAGSSLFPHLAVVRYLKNGESHLEYNSMILEINLKIDPTMTAEHRCMLLNSAVINNNVCTIN